MELKLQNAIISYFTLCTVYNWDHDDALQSVYDTVNDIIDYQQFSELLIYHAEEIMKL